MLDVWHEMKLTWHNKYQEEQMPNQENVNCHDGVKTWFYQAY